MAASIEKIAQPESKTTLQRTLQYIRRTATVSAALFIVWVLAGIWVLVLPSADSPRAADVLFVLGPPDDERIGYAEELMRRGDIGTLAVSSPVDESGEFTAPICRTARVYPVACFHPEPFTTQGEARALRAMSKEYDWHNANILTAQHHVTRARVIIARCYKEDFQMIKFDAHVPFATWPYLYLYHTAAFVKVALTPDC